MRPTVKKAWIVLLVVVLVAGKGCSQDLETWKKNIQAQEPTLNRVQNP